MGRVFTLFVAVMFALAGCGGGGGSAPPAAIGPFDVEGAWTFTWDGNPADTTQIAVASDGSIAWTSDASIVSGAFTVDASGSFSGTITTTTGSIDITGTMSNGVITSATYVENPGSVFGTVSMAAAYGSYGFSSFYSDGGQDTPTAKLVCNDFGSITLFEAQASIDLKADTCGSVLGESLENITNNADGSLDIASNKFFVSADNELIIGSREDTVSDIRLFSMMAKQSSDMDNSSLSGQYEIYTFLYDTAFGKSRIYKHLIEITSPGNGAIKSEQVSDVSGTTSLNVPFTYTISSDGTFNSPELEWDGTLSSNKNVLIINNVNRSGNYVELRIGIKKISTGTVTAPSGKYYAIEFADNAVEAGGSGGDHESSTYELNFNGTSLSYTDYATSTLLGTVTRPVDTATGELGADDPDITGIVSPDGNVVVLSDINGQATPPPALPNVWLMIAVKQ